MTSTVHLELVSLQRVNSSVFIYAKRLRNCIHCMLILTFFACILSRFLLLTVIIESIFIQNKYFERYLKHRLSHNTFFYSMPEYSTSKRWLLHWIPYEGWYDVIYWPSTDPSIKRFSCVNKQKNSGSRLTEDNNITRCPGQFESVRDKMPKWEPVADRGLSALSDPQPRWERSAVMVEEELRVNIAVCPCLQLIPHTQPTSPFRE